MNILDTLLDSAQGGALEQAARHHGLGSSDAQALLKQLVPALTGGMKQNASSATGFEALTQALASGNHRRYVDDPSALAEETTVADGNGILGHLFGSKDVSRNVADRPAEQTGLDSALIKRFLPLVAAAAMGALSKQTSGGEALAQAPSGETGVGALLSGLLDSDNDGQVVDDLMSLGKRLF